jgi:hypothetical protein
MRHGALESSKECMGFDVRSGKNFFDRISQRSPHS